MFRRILAGILLVVMTSLACGFIMKGKPSTINPGVNESNFLLLRVGMSRDEVLSILGEPTETQEDIIECPIERWWNDDEGIRIFYERTSDKWIVASGEFFPSSGPLISFSKNSKPWFSLIRDWLGF